MVSLRNWPLSKGLKKVRGRKSEWKTDSSRVPVHGDQVGVHGEES